MKITVKDMIICGLFVSITALLAQIAIPLPFSTVPITMQVFAVVLTGVVLGGKRGFISQIIYILLGSIGIPVFTQLSGGFHLIVGYTGGFILSFPLIAALMGYISYKTDKLYYMILGVIGSMIINYGLGAMQYAFLAQVTLKDALIVCVAPFIIVDIIKYISAITIGLTLKKRLKL
ncbi:biotin transporter BioY [Clostridium senegalense]|nr:biotin transporter BioY [Clostridium senegalense]MBU5227925.1 biotin transporter BioY [Clostridium senegalense]